MAVYYCMGVRYLLPCVRVRDGRRIWLSVLQSMHYAFMKRNLVSVAGLVSPKVLLKIGLTFCHC